MGYELDFSALAANAGLFAHGIGVTLLLTAITAVAGLILSAAGAAGSVWGGRSARLGIAAYVEMIRNTPFIVQLFFIFFGLPSLGVRLPAFAASVIAMIVNLTAYGKGPIAAQGKEVLGAVGAKEGLVGQWRGQSRLASTADSPADARERLAALTKQVEAADAKIREAARPRKLRFTIVAV